MKCPKCGAETRVVDSRPHKDDATIVVRRRVCTTCEERVTTQESTVDVAAQRRRRRAADKAAYDRLTPEERRAKHKEKLARRFDRGSVDSDQRSPGFQ